MDKDANVYIACGDLLKLNAAGVVVKRWGPNVSNFFVTETGRLFVSYLGNAEEYDKNGNLVGRGMARYEKIVTPVFFDYKGMPMVFLRQLITRIPL